MPVDDPSAPEQGGVPVGISSCLLGEKVRYNGEHRQAALLLDELTPHVRWVPICPEVEVGMGVPREPIQLVEGDAPGPERPCRLVGVESRRDWTESMRDFAALATSRLAALGVSGYIFKSRSPSCGPRGVPIHGQESVPAREGPGVFAAAVMAGLPGLPVAEESELVDIPSCRAFLKRVREFQEFQARRQ